MTITRHRKNAVSDCRSVAFDIRTIESCFQQDVEHAAPLFYYDMHTILWISEGQGELSIDMNRHSIEDECLYYIKPGQSLRVTFGEQARGFLISFGKEFLDLSEKKSFRAGSHLPHQYIKRPVLRVEKDMNAFLKNIAEKMLDEFTNAYDARIEVIASFLKIFMIYLDRQTIGSDNRMAGCRPDLSVIFFRLLEQHYMGKKFVKDYAGILSVTPGYLNKIIKEITGLPASYHIQQRIVLEAKRLTLYEGDSLKEIAYSLGFCSPAHFSKYFKSCAGTNYTIFKKDALNVC